MVLQSDKARVQKLISETLPMLCKNALQFDTEMNIEALIGITLDKDKVLLVSVKKDFKTAPPPPVEPPPKPRPKVLSEKEEKLAQQKQKDLLQQQKLMDIQQRQLQLLKQQKEQDMYYQKQKQSQQQQQQHQQHLHSLEEDESDYDDEEEEDEEGFYMTGMSVVKMKSEPGELEPASHRSTRLERGTLSSNHKAISHSSAISSPQRSQSSSVINAQPPPQTRRRPAPSTTTASSSTTDSKDEPLAKKPCVISSPSSTAPVVTTVTASVSRRQPPSNEPGNLRKENSEFELCQVKLEGRHEDEPEEDEEEDPEDSYLDDEEMDEEDEEEEGFLRNPAFRGEDGEDFEGFYPMPADEEEGDSQPGTSQDATHLGTPAAPGCNINDTFTGASPSIIDLALAASTKTKDLLDSGMITREELHNMFIPVSMLSLKDKGTVVIKEEPDLYPNASCPKASSVSSNSTGSNSNNNSSASNNTSSAYQCKQCQQLLTLHSVRDMADHILAVHKNVARYICCSCGAGYKWRSSLNKHIRKSGHMSASQSQLQNNDPFPVTQ